MPSVQAGQLEKGVLSGEVVSNGRVIWSVNTCSKSPKKKL